MGNNVPLSQFSSQTDLFLFSLFFPQDLMRLCLGCTPAPMPITVSLILVGDTRFDETPISLIPTSYLLFLQQNRPENWHRCVCINVCKCVCGSPTCQRGVPLQSSLQMGNRSLAEGTSPAWPYSRAASFSLS